MFSAFLDILEICRQLMIHFLVLWDHFDRYFKRIKGLTVTLQRYKESWKLPGSKSLRVGAAARRAQRQLRLATREAFLTEDYPMCTANVEKAGQLHCGRPAPTLGHWRTRLLKNLLRLVWLCNS